MMLMDWTDVDAGLGRVGYLSHSGNGDQPRQLSFLGTCQRQGYRHGEIRIVLLRGVDGCDANPLIERVADNSGVDGVYEDLEAAQSCLRSCLNR
jgi:hypothetical protein